jgi:AcrR family transcriptional regulator
VEEAMVGRHLGDGDVGRAVILDAAGELLVTRGLVAVTTEAVVERSGLSRMEIVRRWPSEEALAVDALHYEWTALMRHIRCRACEYGL